MTTTELIRQVEQIEAETLMVQLFIHEPGTDPSAWVDGVLVNLKMLLMALRSSPTPSAHEQENALSRLAPAPAIAPEKLTNAATTEAVSGYLSCHVCGKPAYCIGSYEGDNQYRPACDNCCGHGNEDGWCRPIDDAIAKMSEWIEEANTNDERAIHVLSDLWLWASEARTHLAIDPVPDGLEKRVMAVLSGETTDPQSTLSGEDSERTTTHDHGAELIHQAIPDVEGTEPRPNIELLLLLREIERHCPCGARPETPNTHHHVAGCPVEKAISLVNQ